MVWARRYFPASKTYGHGCITTKARSHLPEGAVYPGFAPVNRQAQVNDALTSSAPEDDGDSSGRETALRTHKAPSS
jgi:hypothetical protein